MTLRRPSSLAYWPNMKTTWLTGDGAALAILFDEHGYALPDAAAPLRSREAIRQFHKGPVGPLVLRAFAFATEGSTGFILGGLSRRAGDHEVGKFTLTLRKAADGKWVIFSDMDNGNRSATR